MRMQRNADIYISAARLGPAEDVALRPRHQGHVLSNWNAFDCEPAVFLRVRMVCRRLNANQGAGHRSVGVGHRSTYGRGDRLGPGKDGYHRTEPKQQEQEQEQGKGARQGPKRTAKSAPLLCNDFHLLTSTLRLYLRRSNRGRPRRAGRHPES